MENEKRLIDANALKEQITKEIHHYWNEGVGGYYLAEDVIPDIELAPTVDAVEVVHGRWILAHGEDGLYYDCSICGHCAGRGRKSNYCPNCGAKMDGDGNG